MTTTISSTSYTHTSSTSPTTTSGGSATTIITKQQLTTPKTKDHKICSLSASPLCSPTNTTTTAQQQQSRSSNVLKNSSNTISAADSIDGCNIKKFSRDSLLRGRCPGSPPQVLRHLRMVPTDVVSSSSCAKRDKQTIVRSPPPGFDSVTSEHLKKVADEAVRDAHARMDQGLSKMTRLHPSAQEFIPCFYKAYNNAKSASPLTASSYSPNEQQQQQISEWNHSHRNLFPSPLPPSRLSPSSSFPSPQTTKSSLLLKDNNNNNILLPPSTSYNKRCPKK
eukprot:GHVS01107722.1.p1 GENE.GHVS01107722.1~~GHVS01107722.1.p1  ORF type:complete len:279 (+),score=95.86 GHVS01107722.1:181-1017(+)